MNKLIVLHSMSQQTYIVIQKKSTTISCAHLPTSLQQQITLSLIFY